jgi:hypothetical protein
MLFEGLVVDIEERREQEELTCVPNDSSQEREKQPGTEDHVAEEELVEEVRIDEEILHLHASHPITEDQDKGEESNDTDDHDCINKRLAQFGRI